MLRSEQSMGEPCWKSLFFQRTMTSSMVPPAILKHFPSHLMLEAGQTLSVSPVIDSGARVMQHITEFPSCHKVITTGFCSWSLIYQAKCKEILQVLSGPQWEYTEVSHVIFWISRSKACLRTVLRCVSWWLYLYCGSLSESWALENVD